MITVREVVVPSTTDEAYEALQKNKFATLLGGGGFLRMGSKNITTLIDLSSCGLNDISEQEHEWHIGAMVTLGELERHSALNRDFSQLFKLSVQHIVGVQLRNVVTLGATVYSRYGFSDLITGLLALPVQVKLYKAGTMSLEVFLEKGVEGRDLLEMIIIPKGKTETFTTSLRNSDGDYSLLNASAALFDGNWRICLGARPGRAQLAVKAMEYLNKQSNWNEALEETARMASEELVFGTNSRGTGAYRKEMAKVLVALVLKEVANSETEHNH